MVEAFQRMSRLSFATRARISPIEITGSFERVLPLGSRDAGCRWRLDYCTERLGLFMEVVSAGAWRSWRSRRANLLRYQACPAALRA